MFVFFFKQKTAYEMRISDWSSDVCSSDLAAPAGHGWHDRATHEPRGLHPDEARCSAMRRRSDAAFKGRRRPGRTASGMIGIFQAGGSRLWVTDAAQIGALSRQARRSEERRVGKECGSTGRTRWGPY